MLQISEEEKILVHGRQFTAILTQDLEDGGYTVTCKEIPSAISQGETVEEALDNLSDALDLCMETEQELRMSQSQERWISPPSN